MKFKAFTIIEVLAVLVINGIVFVIVATTFLYFEQLTMNLNTNRRVLFQYQQLDYLLRNDFYNANTIIYDGNKMVINNPTGLIEYQFEDTVIIRSQEILKDSFNAHYIKEITAVNETGGLISRLNMKFLLYSDTISHLYSKWYDQQTLLRYTEK